MKRTGRILTLKGRVEPTPIDAIVNSGYELSTIFNDDRQGYGWKIIGVDQWTMPDSGAGYPGQQTTTMAPSPSTAQTALSAGATLAGIYGALR